MRRSKKRQWLPGALLALVFAWACGDGAQELTNPARDDGGSPTTPQLRHVVPQVVLGNPSCTDLGYDVGFKPQPEPPPSGSYTFPSTSETVTITSDGTYFEWTSTLSLDAVIVKGGPNANVYAYAPEATTDDALHSPINSNTGQPSAISHIEFCYDYELTAEKEAAGEYDETHTWDVEKSVDPESQMGYAGDELSWTWTVDLSESSVEENFSVSGTITVGNPTPFDVTFEVTDVLGDGTEATVSCPSYELGAGGSVECTYSAAPGDATATKNTATVTSLNPDVDGATAEANIDWTKNVFNGTADINDDQEPDFPLTLTAGQGPWTWTETQSHTCSVDAADYGADGTYSATLNNTAVVTGNDGQEDQSSASTTYTCEAGFMSLLKLTEGVVDASKEWSFALYEGPDGFGGTQVGVTSSTSGDLDGVLEFGNPALRGDLSYTVCELGVPAGWSSEWKVDTDNDGVADQNIIPYNPNADDNPPANEGNLCFEFGAGTAYSVVVGQTLVFEVNNTFPGGDTRTPGYWKNWNRCTSGNQVQTATKNGGPAEGWYLLDDILTSPGIIWGDFQILGCAQGVSILDQRDINTGRKKASDAAYTLAMHLLAAQLNFAAGAGTCPAAAQAALDAENLLMSIGFDGTGSYLRPKDAEYQTALQLAYTLDQYNNGNLCQ
jgi:hypothetical protein